jgi:hypothetical protein
MNAGWAGTQMCRDALRQLPATRSYRSGSPRAALVRLESLEKPVPSRSTGVLVNVDLDTAAVREVLPVTNPNAPAPAQG